MGSRSKGRARAQANASAPAAPQARPAQRPAPQPALRPATVAVAAVIEVIQAAGVLAASIYAGVQAVEGKSYQNSSGIALTVIGIGTAVLLALVALGLARVRRWSRTPALLTQLFTGIIGIYLVQGDRLWIGVPAIALAVAGFAVLLVRPSLHALTASPREAGPPA